MSTPVAATDPTPGSALDPTVRTRARRARGPLLVVALVLLTGLLVALVSSPGRRGEMRPDATDPSGSAALATLLRDQGVDVDLVTDEAGAGTATAGQTVLVALPGRMSTAQRQALARSPADLVLVRPDAATLAALAPGVVADAAALPEVGAPACPLPAAVAAGPVDLESSAYTSAPPAVACYPRGPTASLVVVPVAGRTVTVVGDTAPFANESLAERGNAALTLQLLGAHPRLLWYLPQPDPAAPGQDRDPLDLLPPGWIWGAIQLLVAGVVAALWRARRLGPLVTEPLPVVVRAGETVRGRARLYRKAGARDRAADALRADARRDVTARLGLPRAADPAAITAAVAARTGRAPGEVTHLLHGDAPPDDPALVALAGELDRLVGAVHRA